MSSVQRDHICAAVFGLAELAVIELQAGHHEPRRSKFVLALRGHCGYAFGVFDAITDVEKFGLDLLACKLAGLSQRVKLCDSDVQFGV